MARDTEVVSGTRGGQNLIPSAPSVRQGVQAAAGEVVYVARAANYRLQLIASADVFNAITGRRERGQNVVAKFKDHVFRTKDPETIAMMEAKAKFYGLGRDFWRQEDEQRSTLKAQVDSLANQIRSVNPALLDPESRAALQKALGGEVKAEFQPSA